jgi:hypothetical protein
MDEWMEEARKTSGMLSPFIDKSVVDRLFQVYMLDEDSREEIRAEINFLINHFSNRFALSSKPLIAPPSRQESLGEVGLGRVMYGDETLWDFCLNLDELNRHVLIVASSGHGKTFFLMNLLLQLYETQIPFLVFDFKKDFRHLLSYIPLTVIRWERLRINMLEPPPGVSLQRWEGILCDLYAFNYGWFHGSRNLLQEYLHQLYETKGADSTLPELYDMIRHAKENTRKRQEYYDVVVNRLFSTITNLREVVNCRKSMDIAEMLNRFVVIELDGLARDEQNLLVEFFLFWIYHYRMASNHRGRLRHVLVFDEAKRVFDVNKELRSTTEETGIAPIDIITDEIRDLGEALIVSDQEPSKLTHSIKANTYTKICGSLGHGRDMNEIAEAMNLSDEERDIISHLEPGEWIVKLGGRYTKPFLIKSFHLAVEKHVTDGDVWSQDLSDLYLEEDGKPEEKEIIEISDDAYELLLNVASHPFLGLTGRMNELKFTPKRIEKAKNELVELGLIEIKEISLSGRRPTQFLVLTGRAIELLRWQGIDINLWRHVGNSGFEHSLYQVLIRWNFLKLGYQSHLEVQLRNGRRIDVLATNGKTVGVEVELSVDHLDNKLDCLDELDELYFVTKKEMVETLKSKLGSLPPNVKVVAITDLLTSFNSYFEIKGNNRIDGNKSKEKSDHGNKSHPAADEKMRGG